MKESKEKPGPNVCRRPGQTPQDVCVNTQLTPDDTISGTVSIDRHKAYAKEVEEDVVKINPDVNSMESRG